MRRGGSHVRIRTCSNPTSTCRICWQRTPNSLPACSRRLSALQGLKPENTRLSERVMLLEEEVRWFKEQFFGRSSEKSTSEMSAEQKLLFNEAEVVSAIEAADTAQAACTTALSAHERKTHTGGRGDTGASAPPG